MTSNNGDIRRVLGRNFNSHNNEKQQEQTVKDAIKTPVDDMSVENNENIESSLDDLVSEFINENGSSNEVGPLANNMYSYNESTFNQGTNTSDLNIKTGSSISIGQIIGITIFAIIIIGIISNIVNNYNSSKVSTYTDNTTLQEEIQKEKSSQKVKEESTESASPTEVQKSKYHSLPTEQIKTTQIKKNETVIKTVPRQEAMPVKYTNPYSKSEYLARVKNILVSTFENYVGTSSVDCSIIVIPTKEVKYTNKGWNPEIAYNFLGSQYSRLPKFVDSKGKIVPLVVTFNGKSITNVKFEHEPVLSEPAQKKTTQQVQKQVSPGKSDLQKSQDWFFE